MFDQNEKPFENEQEQIQDEGIDQAQAQEAIAAEVKRDMNEEFEVQPDQELNRMLITPFSAPFSPMVGGQPILNKDYGTSRLNMRQVRFVGLVGAAIGHCMQNPRLVLVLQDYVQTNAFLLNTMPSFGGWGRTMSHTTIGKKELSIESKEKKPQEQSGGLTGLLGGLR